MRGLLISTLILYNAIFALQPLFHSAVYHAADIRIENRKNTASEDGLNLIISSNPSSIVHSACLFNKKNNILEAAPEFFPGQLHDYASEYTAKEKFLYAYKKSHILPSPRSPPSV